MLVLSTFFCRHYFLRYSKYLHRDSNPGQTVRVCDLCSCNLLAEQCWSHLCSTIISFQGAENIFSRFRTYDLYSCNMIETNNFGLGPVLLSCLVSELQTLTSPGLEPRTIFRTFDLSKIFSWFQGMPNLVHSFSSYK
jgi:hypothetical protein